MILVSKLLMFQTSQTIFVETTSKLTCFISYFPKPILEPVPYWALQNQYKTSEKPIRCRRNLIPCWNPWLETCKQTRII